MTIDPTSLQRVCGVDDLEIGEARCFVVEGVPVCLARCNDGFHAISEWCSHADYALSEGELDPESCEIECPQHGSLFSLLTGEPLTLPATEPVDVYPVEVSDGDVFVVMK